MSKKIITFVALAIVIVSVVIVSCVVVNWENSDKPNEYTYAAYGDGYAVTGEKYIFHQDYEIPATFEGKPVVAIADCAFQNSDVRTIVLPDTIVYVGENSFNGCKNLTSIFYKGVENNFIFNGAITGSLSDITVGDNAFKDTNILNITIEDSTDGDTIVEAKIIAVPEFVKIITIDASVNSTTDLVGKNTITPVVGTVDLDFGNYGLFENIVITAYDAQASEISNDIVGGVAVTADHYNIAYLNGTYPVLLFSLQLCHDTGSELNECPTFIYLERSAAYDWENLPENSYMLPFMTYDETAKGTNFHGPREDTAAYVKQLYELNNDSTFTLYCVDNYPELILQYLADNDIPETKWSAVLLTDGAGTAGLLNQTFGNTATPQDIYDELAIEWHNLLAAVYANGYSSEIVRQYAHLASGEYQLLQNYPFVIAKEQSNTSWITGRLRATENLASIDASFVPEITAVATQVYTNNLLAQLTEDEQALFKSLYHFSDEMFKEARDAGKLIMIILGTSASGEDLVSTPGAESEFYNYVKMTMEYYGDDYVYYYKGHPGYPTSLYPHRQEAIAALADSGYILYELDNSVAAEVIMFYNPDVYLAGWQSTTFESVEDQEMACAVYNATKDAFSQTYKSLLDMFMSKLTDSPDPSIVLDPTKTYYLLEYNNTPEYPSQMEQYNKHEIAVYNSTDDVFTFYKWNGSGYDSVER